MDSNRQPAAANSRPPPKPWERVGATSGPTPFRPPSAGNTSDVVESSGTANPGEISNQTTIATVNTNALARSRPTRPWEQTYATTNFGGKFGRKRWCKILERGYGSTINYNSGIGSGMYGSYGRYGGGLYGGGMYGNSMYREAFGGLYGSSGMYGRGTYNGGFAGPMGGYGMGMGGPYGVQDPNNPNGGPPSPPGFWMALLRVLRGVVNFFSRISMLIDQNAQAFHMFMTALLQLFDHSGLLYGKLARFVLRLLGIRSKHRKVHPLGPNGLPLPGPNNMRVNQNLIEGSKVAPSESWDNVLGADAGK